MEQSAISCMAERKTTNFGIPLTMSVIMGVWKELFAVIAEIQLETVSEQRSRTHIIFCDFWCTGGDCIAREPFIQKHEKGTKFI